MFQTKDQVLIVGDWMSTEKPKAAALLLHMMPATRESWDELQEALEKKNIASLAIDLRGHGESMKQGLNEIDYKNFTDFEHQETMLDIEASFQFLAKKGFTYSNIFLVGASIGANLALQAASEHKQIPAVVFTVTWGELQGNNDI